MKAILQTLLVSCTFLLSGTGTSFGQSSGDREEMKEVLMKSTPEQRADTLTSIMARELDLKNDQISNVRSVNLKYAQKAENMKTSEASRKDKFQSAKNMDEEKDGQLKPILTEDQYKKYQQKKNDIYKEMTEKLSN